MELAFGLLDVCGNPGMYWQASLSLRYCAGFLSMLKWSHPAQGPQRL